MRSRLDYLLAAVGFVLVVTALSQSLSVVPATGSDSPPTQAADQATGPDPAATLDGSGATQEITTNPPAGPSATPPPQATATRTAIPYVPPATPQTPERIIIPAIHLDAPILPTKLQTAKVNGREVQQWKVPNEFAAGWHVTSAKLGEPGNTILNGHHNTHGEVFVHLVDLEPGDKIIVESTTGRFTYVITNRMILPEKYEGFDVRMENGRWILPSDDERLTLITCWPYETNTHRLIIVATPVSYEPVSFLPVDE